MCVLIWSRNTQCNLLKIKYGDKYSVRYLFNREAQLDCWSVDKLVIYQDNVKTTLAYAKF